MRALVWIENTGRGSTRSDQVLNHSVKSSILKEVLQKGENVRGAAQKFERSVSNEEERKQQPVR